MKTLTSIIVAAFISVMSNTEVYSVMVFQNDIQPTYFFRNTDNTLSAHESLFFQLSEVNKEWLKQKDVPDAVYRHSPILGEHAIIKAHLMFVENILRNRNVNKLSPELQKARQQNLDDLRDYWKAGAFPVNTVCEFRIPIFIDPFDNFCAVGYLIKASGHEKLSRYVAEHSNFAYLKEMNYPELSEWAGKSGLTLEELAWIQPTYYHPPYTVFESMGAGINGSVNVMLGDSSSERHLYVGGRFTEVNGKSNVNNIAVWSQSKSGWNWMQLGKGINGIVHSMAFYNNELFVGGEFTNAGGVAANNIARWDNKQWHTAGSLSGIVYALAVYDGQLYAGGDFTGSYKYQGDYSGTVHFSNFAKWDGNRWIGAGNDIDGPIYAFTVYDNHLIVGGEFAWWGNNVTWFDGNDFIYQKQGIPASVRCFAVYNDILYAGGDMQNCDSMFGIAKFTGNSWETIFTSRSFGFPIKPGDHIASLAVYKDILFFAGKFSYHFDRCPPGYMCMSGTYSRNLASCQDGKFTDIGVLDAPVHALHSFAGLLFLGGRFKNAAVEGSSWTARPDSCKRLNSISFTDLSSRLDKHKQNLK